MRQKARRLAQTDGPPGFLEESDPAEVFIYVMDGQYTACHFRAVPVALSPDRSYPAPN